MEMRLVGAITGLGERETDFHFRGDLVATPTIKTDLVQVQATADTEEALNIGGITTEQMLIIYAVENSVYVDTSFSVTFNAELLISEGEFSVFTPTGSVYIKNAVAGETVTCEVIAVGV